MARMPFIVSGATCWVLKDGVLKDGTKRATGYRAEDFTKPYRTLTDAGAARPNAVHPEWSRP